MSFELVGSFEKEIAEFFGSKHAVAVDCCTHAIELCLYLEQTKKIFVPKRTYISVPLLSKKLNINLEWNEIEWKNFYYLTPEIIDAAVLWQRNSYINNTYMCVSFQFKKHLSLGRGGAILLNNKKKYLELKKMSYDGRLPNIPWAKQNINTMGYHYYMTPETASIGLKKLFVAKNTEPKNWSFLDYPDVSKMKVFRK